MWSAWWILWALTCQIHVVAGKYQVAISCNMNNCGTKQRVMLHTSKLNSSDSQVLRAGIFLLHLQERVTPALFKNVMNPSINIICEKKHEPLYYMYLPHILHVLICVYFLHCTLQNLLVF
jgi:hypothetical protein